LSYTLKLAELRARLMLVNCWLSWIRLGQTRKTLKHSISHYWLN
jgi:hypothetical protein